LADTLYPSANPTLQTYIPILRKWDFNFDSEGIVVDFWKWWMVMSVMSGFDGASYSKIISKSYRFCKGETPHPGKSILKKVRTKSIAIET